MQYNERNEIVIDELKLCYLADREQLACLAENNLPGIGKWIEDNHLGIGMGYLAASGFCGYPLYTLF